MRKGGGKEGEGGPNGGDSDPRRQPTRVKEKEGRGGEIKQKEEGGEGKGKKKEEEEEKEEVEGGRRGEGKKK